MAHNNEYRIAVSDQTRARNVIGPLIQRAMQRLDTRRARIERLIEQEVRWRVHDYTRSTMVANFHTSTPLPSYDDEHLTYLRAQYRVDAHNDLIRRGIQLAFERADQRIDELLDQIRAVAITG